MSKEKEVKGNVVDMDGVEVEATVKDAPKKKKMALSTKVAIAGLVIGVPLAFAAFAMPAVGSGSKKGVSVKADAKPTPPVNVEPTPEPVVEPVVEPTIIEMA